MTMELKACPFCEGDASFETIVLSETWGYNERYAIKCGGCGAAVYGRSRKDKNGWIDDPDNLGKIEAIAAWNTRTPDPEILTLRARVAELEGDNRKALVAFTVIETLSPVWSMDVDENMERLKSVAREASATLSKAKEIVDHG